MRLGARWVRPPPCYSSHHPGGLEDAMKLPARVTICEVGTRDGFQIEPDFIPTEQKIEVVDLLSDAGIPEIEVTSFVHPKVVRSCATPRKSWRASGAARAPATQLSCPTTRARSARWTPGST